MAQPREVVICGWLQNVRKKTGTLLRKKKLMCDEAMWVALCVHNGRAPHLEWYPNEECMYDHRPKQLLDLLEVALVARSADPRMFVIEFKDENRPSLEFCALSPEESKRWVDGSRNTLNSLSCMIEDNYYLECPSERFPILPDRRPGNDVDENIMPSAAPNENAPVEVAREARRADINGTVIPPPTLQRNGTYEHIVRGISLLNPERTSPPTTTPIPQSRALMRQPRSIDRPPLPPRKDEEEDFAEWVPSTSKTNDLYNVPKQPTNSIRNTLYDSLPSPEPAQIPQHTRTRSTSSSSDSSMECLSALNSQNATLKVTKRSVAFSDDDCDIRNSEIYTRPRSSYSDDSATVALEQAFSKPRTICLQLSVCVEQLALVEVEGRIWVAGWTPEYNKQLNQMLRVGDEVLEVGGEQLNSMTQIPAVFHTHTIPGTPVSIKIRSIPVGNVCSFVKPLSGSKTLGITLHKKKNRIDAIVEGSVAAKARLPVVMKAFLKDDAYVSSVITDVDDTPMDPFANNEQLIRRLETIRPGSVFTITVHPHDFIKALKTQLKQMKKYKKFVIEN